MHLKRPPLINCRETKSKSRDRRKRRESSHEPVEEAAAQSPEGSVHDAPDAASSRAPERQSAPTNRLHFKPSSIKIGSRFPKTAVRKRRNGRTKQGARLFGATLSCQEWPGLARKKGMRFKGGDSIDRWPTKKSQWEPGPSPTDAGGPADAAARARTPGRTQRNGLEPSGARQQAPSLGTRQQRTGAMGRPLQPFESVWHDAQTPRKSTIQQRMTARASRATVPLRHTPFLYNTNKKLSPRTHDTHQ